MVCAWVFERERDIQMWPNGQEKGVFVEFVVLVRNKWCMWELGEPRMSPISKVTLLMTVLPLAQA